MMTPRSEVTPPVPRQPTYRKLSSFLSDAPAAASSRSPNDAVTHNSTINSTLLDRASAIQDRAQRRVPLTEEEVQGIVNSLDHLRPHDYNIARPELEAFLKERCHLPHTDWEKTGDSAEVLGKILLQSATDAAEKGLHRNPALRQVLERVLLDGKWDPAAEHAARNDNLSQNYEPWIVLVTGVNGIRKTTSMYMPWFPDLLQEALVAPHQAAAPVVDKETLPTGTNSFFRQLDHLIATLCNEEFAILYQLTADRIRQAQQVNDRADSATTRATTLEPTVDIVNEYSKLKAALFSRYRTLSEIVGVWLLQQAQLLGANCMLETSGRDVAMFHYVDYFFKDSQKPKKYRKLALHFEINCLELAKASVDQRMVREIQLGAKALASNDAFEVVQANLGGPYGSQVLDQVLKDSDQVWEQQVLSGKVGCDWYKATIRINAHADKPWTAQAVKPDGTRGKEYTFDSTEPAVETPTKVTSRKRPHEELSS